MSSRGSYAMAQTALSFQFEEMVSLPNEDDDDDDETQQQLELEVTNYKLSYVVSFSRVLIIIPIMDEYLRAAASDFEALTRPWSFELPELCNINVKCASSRDVLFRVAFTPIGSSL